MPWRRRCGACLVLADLCSGTIFGIPIRAIQTFVRLQAVRFSAPIPDAVVDSHSTALAPPLARSLLACQIVSLLPVLRSPYAALAEKPTR